MIDVRHYLLVRIVLFVVIKYICLSLCVFCFVCVICILVTSDDIRYTAQNAPIFPFLVSFSR